MSFARSRWKQNFIDLGEMHVKDSKIFYFDALVNLEIIKIDVGCSCTSPYYDKKKKRLKVKYTPNPVPVHLKQKGYYVSHKEITVVYNTGQTDILTFKATVYDTKPSSPVSSEVQHTSE